MHFSSGEEPQITPAYEVGEGKNRGGAVLKPVSVARNEKQR